jgi:hypothetical protein
MVLAPGFCVGHGNGLLLGYLTYRSGVVPDTWPCWASSAAP